MKSKRLCIVIPPHWSYQMGGSQYQAKLLVERLVQEGNCEVHYLARKIGKQHQSDGYELRQIAEEQGLRRYSYLLDYFPLMRLLREIRPDVIYQRVGCAYTGICARYASEAGCRLVWHIAHDRTLAPMERDLSLSYPIRYVDHLVLEYGIARATTIVAQSMYQKDALLRRYRRHACVIRNFHPMPDEELSSNRTDNEPGSILWIANLKPWKQPEVFLRLARELSNLPAKFIMLGKPSDDRRWMTQLEVEMSALPNVAYYGQVLQGEVNRLLQHADLFVNTSVYEGFANTYIQAWQRSVPVLSLQVDPDGVLGRHQIGFCAQGNYNALRDAIVQYMSNRELRDSVGRNSRNYAKSYHSMDNLDVLIRVILHGE